MADDGSSGVEGVGGSANLALQTVNNPLTLKLMFAPSPQNALDTDDVCLSAPHTHTNLLIDPGRWGGGGRGAVLTVEGVRRGVTLVEICIIMGSGF